MHYLILYLIVNSSFLSLSASTKLGYVWRARISRMEKRRAHDARSRPARRDERGGPVDCLRWRLVCLRKQGHPRTRSFSLPARELAQSFSLSISLSLVNPSALLIINALLSHTHSLAISLSLQLMTKIPSELTKTILSVKNVRQENSQNSPSLFPPFYTIQ